MNALHLLALLIILGVALTIGTISCFALYSIRLQNRTDNWVHRWNRAVQREKALEEHERREAGESEQETTPLVPEV